MLHTMMSASRVIIAGHAQQSLLLATPPYYSLRVRTPKERYRSHDLEHKCRHLLYSARAEYGRCWGSADGDRVRGTTLHYVSWGNRGTCMVNHFNVYKNDDVSRVSLRYCGGTQTHLI